MRPFRAAVIGTGFIGPVHVEGLRRAGVEVAALIGSTSEKTHTACQRSGIAPDHESLESVLSDASIDAVHLTTPNQLHYPQVQAVLRSGKHVLCEKPLALAWNSESPNELWIDNRDTANQSLIRDPCLLQDSAAQIAAYPGGHNEGFPDTFKQLFRQFYQYIGVGDLSAAAPFPTFAEGHQEILLCEAILQSHHERGWVTVGGAG